MEHYNRDNFEKSHTSEELYHRTSRSQSNSLKRKDFVVSFIASAIVGSAVGLYYKNKIYKKTDELKEKEQDLRSKVENYRQRAEDTVVSVKSKVEQLKYDSKDNIHADELQAQKAAIQRETDLADESPEAQAIQEAKKDRINNNNEVASNTKNLMQEEAIKASNNSDVPNLVTNLNQSQASDTNSVAYRLAQASKEKRSKLTNGSKETQLTEALLKEPSIAKAQTKLKRIPTLITESKKHSNNPHSQKNSNQTKNITATKEDSKGKQQHTPNQNKRNKQQKVEKTSSKIEKRTFND